MHYGKNPSNIVPSLSQLDQKTMFKKGKTVEIASKLVSSANIIGRGTSIRGDVQSEGSIRLEGKLQGNLKTESKLVLAADSHLKGNVVAKSAEIAGKLEGEITVNDTLVFRAKAVVVGIVHTRQLIVEEGAQFDGQCHMHTEPNELPVFENQVNQLLTSEVE